MPLNLMWRSLTRLPMLNVTTTMQRRTFANAVPKDVRPNCVRANDHRQNVALTDHSDVYTYGELLDSSRRLAAEINRLCNRTLQNRIAYLCSNDASYVVTQWATWLSGNVAVPLHRSHPPPQLEYYIKDSQSPLIVCTSELKHKVEAIASTNNIPCLVVGNTKSALKFDEFDNNGRNGIVDDQFYNDSEALIIYTSGTTGPPKGVVLTHANLEAQVETIVEAFRLNADDCVLHVLPLHHTHGIVHALLSPLHVGARINMLPQFSASVVWNEILSPRSERVNVFLAVPTMYIKLLEEAWKRDDKRIIRTLCMEKMRLMVSGSSALPEPIFERWEQLTGHRILERYGMTEIGLALTNPFVGERKSGFVGNPIGCVEVCVAVENERSPNGYDVVVLGNEHGTVVTPGKDGDSGELYVRGPNVFKEYFNKPEATTKTFSSDGWFKTGDTVTFREGMYKIEGRTSVDIIKSGGYKISALDVERHLLSHSNIADVSVVGLSDPTWGQRVAAIVVTRGKGELLLPELREWCKRRMAPYTVPTVLRVVEQLPKNAVGKVNKKDLVREMFPESLKSSKL